jgi:diacylglycerol O-acyltransferase
VFVPLSEIEAEPLSGWSTEPASSWTCSNRHDLDRRASARAAISDQFAIDAPCLIRQDRLVERLSSLDASFLRVETPVAHMHVGWLADLDLPAGEPPLELEEVRARIASKLHLTPRFRQRLRDAPLGEAFWADDRRFRVEDHVNAAPPVTGPAELRALCGEFLSRPLDRNRPLWEILLVPRAGPGRAAVLGKVHHAMVDGIAAVQLGVLLFDLEPEPERPLPVPWEPSRDPSPVRVAAQSVADVALEQFRTARRAAGMGLRPGQTLRAADSVRRAAFSLAGELVRPAPRSFLRAPLSPRRVLVPARLPMARARELAASAGVKLNDVILAMVAGALRELAGRIGEPPETQRAMVPINVRNESDRVGNRITFGLVDLPIHLPGPAQRLRAVVREMAELKGSGFAAGSDLLLRSTALLPGALKQGVARAAASPRTYNLTVSNVPGPKASLFAAGARVASIHPVIPISEGHALSVGVLSYDHTLHFGVYADPVALPEAAQLEHLIPAELDQLEAAHRGRPAEPEPEPEPGERPLLRAI